MDCRSETMSSKENAFGSDGGREDLTAAAAASEVPATTGATTTSVARKKKPRKKRRAPDAEDGGSATKQQDGGGKEGKTKKKRSKEASKEAKEKRKERRLAAHKNAQQLANEVQMRRALEEDRYSALGSIVSGTDTEEEEDVLQPSDIRVAMRKRLWTIERRGKKAALSSLAVAKSDSEGDGESFRSSGYARRGRKKKKKTKSSKGGGDDGDALDMMELDSSTQGKVRTIERPSTSMTAAAENEEDPYEEGSIFGPTTGSTQTTWVECDKCKKWRRLRGVVDESKLPSRWYCSMNKNDPDRARCSAPEEEYSETPKPEENAVEKRVRKHLRVWIRRLETQQAFRDARRPITRGTKRTATGNSKEPYEWVQCCACGKWRAGLRFMDKSQFLLDRTSEWYCVMNTWDEKMASCAAPQENLPAIGCPPWVMQDES